MGGDCPNLLDFVGNNNREEEDEDENRHGRVESSNLELRLGLPGDHHLKNNPVRKGCSFPELGFPSNQWIHHNNCSRRGAIAIGMHNVDLQISQVKEFSPASVNTATVHNSSHKRGAPGAVVGWPPVRSFRKSIASSSSSKPVSEPHSSIPSKPLNGKPGGSNSNKGMFVKINMDGVPIGRKVDLNAYDTYQKLISSVDVLFRGLLAAQRDSGNEKEEEQKRKGGLLDGSGEYNLVYEDIEGDRMLVGDVPWHMFLSTVKRLRVIKTSDLSTLCRGGSKNDKEAVKSSPK